MRGRIVFGESELGPGNAIPRIEHAEAEARFEQTLNGKIDFAVGKQAIRSGKGHSAKLRTATQVRSGFYGEGSGLFEGENVTVGLMEVADGPAIGDDITFEAPLFAKCVEEKVIGTRGLTEHGVIGAHDGVGLALHNRSAKRWRVGVGEIVRRDGHVEAMAQNLRTAMDGVVLGR